MTKILIVAAHPDDEVLGCGGTIAALTSSGVDVTIAILAEGITSRSPERAMARRDLVEHLHATARAASLSLGVERLILKGLPDNRLDSLPLLDVIKVVEELIDTVSPDVVYTHHAGDLNIDHVVINRAVLTATRPCGGKKVGELYAFEVPSSTEWGFQRLEPVFRPNVFVDITKTLDKKIQAMNHYESEVRSFPHPRSPEALDAIARRWGSVCGCRAAEAFELIRSIR